MFVSSELNFENIWHIIYEESANCHDSIKKMYLFDHLLFLGETLFLSRGGEGDICLDVKNDFLF
jgi:hypothetical protein